MAELMFNGRIAQNFCNFTHGGVSFSSFGNQTLDYLYFNANPTLSIKSFAIETDTIPEASLGLTAELIIGNNSTGLIPFSRTTQGSKARFTIPSSTPNSVAVPSSDSDVSVQVVISADGTEKTRYTFNIPPPIMYAVSSISPSPATGKVCTVTLNRSIPDPETTPWRLNEKIIVAAYHDDPAYRLSVYGYKTDMVTRIESFDYGFSSFTFYVPYDSSRTRTDDLAKIRLNFFVSLADYVFFTSYLSYYFEYTFSMSYVNQTDPLAAPTVTLNAIAENPSGMMAKYGKYVGGGIGNLTFSIASVAYKFGAAFSKRTMSLYHSNGTLSKSWEYSNTNSFTLSLTNTTDSAWYMVVSITDTSGRVGSATTATFQVYGYEAPSILGLNASRCDQDGTPNDSGAYCKISYQFKIYALGNHNAKNVTLNAPDQPHVYTNLDYDHGSAYQYISEADTETSYRIDLIVEDDFNEVSQTMNLSTAGVIMDFLYNGKGIGLGKVAETSNMVEVNPQWTFKAQTIMIRGQDLATILQSLGYTFPT